MTAEIIQQPDSSYPIVIDPAILHLDDAGNLKAEGAEFTITNVSDEDLGVDIIYTPHGYFDLELPALLKSGEAAQCRISVQPERAKDNFEKSITIQVNDQLGSRFTIPLIQRITGARIISTKGDRSGEKPD